MQLNMHMSFPLQKGRMVVLAIQSPVSRTQRYDGSSSNFSAGCGNTLTAARTSASNFTTNGVSGYRKLKKRTTRLVRRIHVSFRF